jgi:iron complex outermembrane receptor protein
MQSTARIIAVAACQPQRRAVRTPFARRVLYTAILAALATTARGQTAQNDAGDAAQKAAAGQQSAAAPPADDGASPLQEIVITATRHEESQSKVPVSVSAFTQEEMDRKGIKDFNDVARFTPGVTIDTNGTNAISIRGISSSGGSGTTGIYIDDTPIQMRALGFNPDDTLPKTFDLDRIEVLRGPQGTLFGAGSEGGTVRYIMTQPSLYKSSMYARTEASFTQDGRPSYEAGVAGGGPVVDDTVGVRASIWYRHDGGWIDQIDPTTLATVDKDANYSDTVVMRLAALYAPTANVSITPSVLYQDRQTHNNTVYWPIYSNPSSNSYRDADPDRRPEPDHYLLPALKVEADLGRVTFISNTSYYQRTDLSGYPGTVYNLGYYQSLGSDPTQGLPFLNPANYPLIDQNGIHLPAGVQNYRSPATVTNQQRDVTQEFRLQSNDPNARLNWTAGVFISVDRETSIEEINDPMVDTLFETLFGVPATGPTGFFGVPLLANGDSYYNMNYSKDNQLAGFGELTYGVTDKLKLTAGARYSKTDVNFFHAAEGPQNFGLIAGSGSQHEKPFTPKLGASYQIDPADMVYANYAKGFRIGGANAPIPAGACNADYATLGIADEPDSYHSDTVQSYEIGAKRNLSNQFKIAASAYYINWKGIQQNIYLPGCGFQFTTNLGTAVAKGFDLQAEWAPSAALVLESALGYTSARYSKNAALSPGSSAAPTAISGDAITGESGTAAPPWTLALGAQYNFTALDHRSFARIDYQYESRNKWLTAAEDAGTSQFDPYAYTPASSSFVSVRTGTKLGGWDVSAFIDNLFDSHPQLPPSSQTHSDIDPNALPGQGVLIRAYTLRPRTLGITATYRM